MAKEQNLYDIIFNVKEKINLILRHWKMLICYGVVGIAIGCILSYFNPVKYTGKLSFIIEEGDNKGGGVMSLASSMGLTNLSGGGMFNTPNIISFLQTRNLVEKALLSPIDENSNTTFAQLYIDAYNMQDEWKDNENLKSIKFSPNEDRSKFSLQKDSILGVVYNELIEGKKINIKQLNKDVMVVDINVTTLSEQFSYKFSSKLIDIVGEYYTEIKTRKQKKNLDVLQRQVDSVRYELNRAMGTMANSNDRIFGLNPSMTIHKVPISKSQVDIQANTLILSELYKNLELTKLALYNQTPLIQVVDYPVLPLNKNRFGYVLAIFSGGFIAILLCILIIIFKDFYSKSEIKSKR